MSGHEGKQPRVRPEIIENATGGYAASDSTSPDKRGVATAPISVRESEAASVVPGGSGCASVAEAPPAAEVHRSPVAGHAPKEGETQHQSECRGLLRDLSFRLIYLDGPK